MIEVKNVAFDSENEQSIRSIRESVFINEQSIAPEIEFDGLDSSAIHAVVTVDGKHVGTRPYFKRRSHWSYCHHERF